MRSLVVFAGVVGFMIAATASARISQAQQDGVSQGGAAQQQFDELFPQWREKLKELRRLQVEYQLVEPRNQAAIEQQFEDLLAEAEEISKSIHALAEQAYIDDPNDRDKADFLVYRADEFAKRDNYEEALRIAQILHDADVFFRGSVLEFIGECNYVIGNYDTAQAQLEDAEKALAELDPPRMLRDVTSSMKNTLVADRSAWTEELEYRRAEETPEVDPEALPRVEIETTQGKIVVELYENEAPNTVANFISLVENGFYDELPFYAVRNQHSAETGCPNSDGTGNPGYFIPSEAGADNPYRKHFRGSLSMETQNGLAGSRFLIITRRESCRARDGMHTVFGRVIEGLDVVSDFARPDRGESYTTIEDPDRILSAAVIRKRDHEYKPAKFGEESNQATGGADAGGADDGGDAGDATGSGGAGDGGTGDGGTGDGGTGDGGTGDGGTGDGGTGDGGTGDGGTGDAGTGVGGAGDGGAGNGGAGGSNSGDGAGDNGAGDGSQGDGASVATENRSS